MRRGISRTLTVAVLAGGLGVASPLAAQACGCGGFVADEKVSVHQETAVVQLTPGHEVVSMQFAADTTATKAAWVMPVPRRASMELGDQALFDQLEQLTAPEVRTVEVEGDDDGDGRGAGAAPPSSAPPVSVTDRVTLGPYDVAQLTGSDPKAVAKWLTDNGFTISPKLSEGLAKYLSDGWQVVAVKMSGAGDHSLGGVLPPLRVSFDSPRAVYPMRLSAGASTPQSLRLYVLADHKMSATSPAPADGELQLYFAGVNDQARYPAVPATAGTPTFVTRYDGDWPTPSDITDDISFTQAPDDQPYKTVITQRKVVHHSVTAAADSSDSKSDFWHSGTALTLGIVVLALALVSTATGAVMLSRRRRP
ncbi:DUF2330 domain-containing protein [Labedaea rhizosphaerae]|uniref:Uncharacterized protein DUF2330 n=1 Tax=Labedaea rhizosphaerae TaxID=598644 RepID=A0A4R6SNP9_LABRH|nr:DUF2330 domain-containing protein [Labedaea rhizosphaerae]TDQ05624.1 uncharacterized protein DUF2330 [Labedaea rhizosphaerae]